MITSAARGSLRDLSQANDAAARLGQQLITGRKVETPRDDPSAWLQAARARSTAGYLAAIHTGLNELATNIRVADTAMQAIGEHLATMQGQLDQARKYPAGHPTREQLISDFNAMRRQIDELVETTAQTGARNLMSDPAQDRQAGDIQAMVGVNGERKTVHAQQVHTGPDGLNIPKLTADATGAGLENTARNLESARTTLAARRQALASAAGDIARYTDGDSSLSGLYQSQAESLTGGDPAEAAVELQSVTIRQSLAVQSLAGISANRNAILELLH